MLLLHLVMVKHCSIHGNDKAFDGAVEGFGADDGGTAEDVIVLLVAAAVPFYLRVIKTE